MPDLITVLGVVIGWILKTYSETWTWRRQQGLDAYLELIDAADRYAMQVSRLWNAGSETAEETMPTVAWVAKAEEVRGQGLVAVDRAHGKLSLVSGWLGSRVSGELYIACDRMFRRVQPVDWNCTSHVGRELTF